MVQTELYVQIATSQGDPHKHYQVDVPNGEAAHGQMFLVTERRLQVWAEWWAGVHSIGKTREEVLGKGSSKLKKKYRASKKILALSGNSDWVFQHG